jgi:hypothetical protein
MLLADLVTFAGTIASIALVLMGIAAAFMYIGGPLLIYFSHKQTARPNLVPFQPGVTPLPADVDQYFHATSWALAQQGFEIVTGMFLPSQVENVIVALIFLVNRQEKDGAICVAMHNKAPGMMQTFFHAEFVTRYRDGRVIQTNNAQSPQCISCSSRMHQLLSAERARSRATLLRASGGSPAARGGQRSSGSTSSMAAMHSATWRTQ